MNEHLVFVGWIEKWRKICYKNIWLNNPNLYFLSCFQNYICLYLFYRQKDFIFPNMKRFCPSLMILRLERNDPVTCRRSRWFERSPSTFCPWPRLKTLGPMDRSEVCPTVWPRPICSVWPAELCGRPRGGVGEVRALHRASVSRQAEKQTTLKRYFG